MGTFGQRKKTCRHGSRSTGTRSRTVEGRNDSEFLLTPLEAVSPRVETTENVCYAHNVAGRKLTPGLCGEDGVRVGEDPRQ